jgi:hypothetical protein
MTTLLLILVGWWLLSSACSAVISTRIGVAVNKELIISGPLGTFKVLQEAAAQRTPIIIDDLLPEPPIPPVLAAAPAPLPIMQSAPSPIEVAPEPIIESAPAALPPETVASVNVYDSIKTSHERPFLPTAAIEPDSVAVIDGRYELEAFDRLPQRPRAGFARTVCPTCHKRTRHDREAVCRKCKQQNRWLAERWEVDEQSAYADMPALGLVAPHEQTSFSGQVRCPGCSRRAVVDLHGRCSFCNTQIGAA